MAFRYNISGLSAPKDQSGLIAHLKSFPEFKGLETQMYLDSPDGGKTHQKGTISASLTVRVIQTKFRYKDYLVAVFAVLGEIYIICAKQSKRQRFC